MPRVAAAGEQLPVLYYKEGERLSELSNFVQEGGEHLVEVRWPPRLPLLLPATLPLCAAVTFPTCKGQKKQLRLHDQPH